jgi:hypothetical protein
MNPKSTTGVLCAMLRFLVLVPFMAAMLLLSCSKNDPVDEKATGVSDALVGDASAAGLASPANAATAEAVQQAAIPPSSGGLGWAYRQQDNSALFGPAGSPAFSIQCQKPKEGEAQLIFVRYLPPTTGAQATLSFTGNGKAASVPIAAVTNPNGLAGQWRAMVAPNDSARDIAEAFAGPGNVEISITGTAPLVVPPTAEPRRVLASCLGR